MSTAWVSKFELARLQHPNIAVLLEILVFELPQLLELSKSEILINMLSCFICVDIFLYFAASGNTNTFHIYTGDSFTEDFLFPEEAKTLCSSVSALALYYSFKQAQRRAGRNKPRLSGNWVYCSPALNNSINIIG